MDNADPCAVMNVQRSACQLGAVQGGGCKCKMHETVKDNNQTKCFLVNGCMNPSKNVIATDVTWMID
jgi:hypothetical protein